MIWRDIASIASPTEDSVAPFDEDLPMLAQLGPFDAAISLGIDCRVRYQISLDIYRRISGKNFSQAEFNKNIFGSRGLESPFGTNFFDWTVTPFSALQSCISEDFRDVFRLENLHNDAGGSIKDSRNGIVYHHNFSRMNKFVTSEILQAEYPAQKRKVDHLAAKFVNHFGTPDRIIYVRYGSDSDDIPELTRILLDKCGGHNFFLLAVSPHDRDSYWGSISDHYAIYRMTTASNKPESLRWQGDDLQWGSLLSQINYNALGRAALD